MSDVLDNIADRIEDLYLGMRGQATLLWATVTQASPLRVRIDGDDAPLLSTPRCPIPNLQVGERVLCAQQNQVLIVVQVAGRDYSQVGHQHSAADITSGTVAPARLPAATESAIGAVERATQAEVNAGSDTTRYVSPATLKGVTDGLASSSHTHAWSAITGKPSTYAPSSHSHSAADITSGTMNQARLPRASQSAWGISAAAPQSDVNAGTDSDNKYVTAATLRNSANLPYAMAAGSVSVANGATATVTLPSGRFNVTPIVKLELDGATNSSNVGLARLVERTSTAIKVQVWTIGGAHNGGTVLWTATQMRSNAANG